MDSLAPLGITTPTDLVELSASLPALKWSQEAQDEADEAWERIRGGLTGRRAMAIDPGSGGARKRWPPGHFAVLIRDVRRDYAPILIAAQQDEEVVAQVVAEAGATPTVRALSVAGLAAFLPRCALYVGNDSGVTHLASLLGVPTVALFGPTEPALGAPLGLRVVTLQSPTGQMGGSLSPGTVITAISALEPHPLSPSPTGEGEPHGDQGCHDSHSARAKARRVLRLRTAQRLTLTPEGGIPADCTDS